MSRRWLHLACIGVLSLVAPGAMSQDVAPIPGTAAYVPLRPDREFWEVVRHSADTAEAVVRVQQRFGPFPIAFSNWMALGIRPDPVNEAVGMPAIMVDVLVRAGPSGSLGRHTRPVWLSPLKYHGRLS